MQHAAAWQVARLVMAGFLVFVGPFLDLRTMRRLREGREGWRRLRLYRLGTASLWAFGLACFTLMGGRGIRRLPPQVLQTHGIFASQGWRIGLTVVVVAFFGVSLLPGAVCLFRERTQKAYTKALTKSSLSYLLPENAQQRRWYASLSVAAGVCEEVMFRGFLLMVARQDLHMGLGIAVLLTSIAFGLNHLYQGLRGMVQTALTGLMLCLAAVLTEGLVVPMLLHAAIDLQILWMFKPHDDAPAPS